jgi:hypothetical protein
LLLVIILVLGKPRRIKSRCGVRGMAGRVIRARGCPEGGNGLRFGDQESVGRDGLAKVQLRVRPETS